MLLLYSLQFFSLSPLLERRVVRSTCDSAHRISSNSRKQVVGCSKKRNNVAEQRKEGISKGSAFLLVSFSSCSVSLSYLVVSGVCNNHPGSRFFSAVIGDLASTCEREPGIESAPRSYNRLTLVFRRPVSRAFIVRSFPSPFEGRWRPVPPLAQARIMRVI